MSFFVPAICRQCGDVWFPTFLFDGPGNVIITKSTMQPCPTCGGVGDIPDGNYTAVSTSFFQQPQFDHVVSALLGLKNKIDLGATPVDIHAEIETTPALEWLKRFIPKDWKDMNEILTAFTKVSVLMAGLIAACRTGVLTGQIGIPSHLVQSLREFVSPHPAPQHVDHNTNTANTTQTNNKEETQKPTNPSNSPSPPKE